MTRSPAQLDESASGAGWSKRLFATAAAAAVASSITTILVSAATSVDSLLWILGMRNASPELKSLLGFDFKQALATWPQEALLNIAFAPFVGTAFGFVGAFLFLGFGFLFVRGAEQSLRRIAVVGALVGLAHSAVGFSLRGVELLPWDLQMAAEPLVGWVALVGGFFLVGAPNPIAVLATFIGAPIAGVAAGLVYARILRGARRSPTPTSS